MVAQKGYIETAENGDRFVVLLNGRRYEGTPGTLDYRTVDFDRYMLRIEPRGGQARGAARQGDGHDGAARGQPTPEQVAELHWRLALPLAVRPHGALRRAAVLREPAHGALVEPRARGPRRTRSTTTCFRSSRRGPRRERSPAGLGLWPVHLTMVAILALLFCAPAPVSRRWFGFAALTVSLRAGPPRYNFGLPRSASASSAQERDDVEGSTERWMSGLSRTPGKRV